MRSVLGSLGSTLRRRSAPPDPLGHGVWRRLHDDCAGAARLSDELAALLPAVRARAVAGQQRWPSDSLDVPAAVAGRAHYEHLRTIRREFGEVAYRTRLATSGVAGAGQATLAAQALDRVRSLLDDGAGPPTARRR